MYLTSLQPDLRSPLSVMINRSPFWSIRLLGNLQLQRRGQTITRFRTRKTASLLAYLALYSDSSHSRIKLIDLFWPDSDTKDGRNSLRVSLNALRRQLEPDPSLQGQVLLSIGDQVQLNQAYCQTDVSQFQACLLAAETTAPLRQKIAHWKQALQYYGCDLLPNDGSLWVEQEASRLRELHLKNLCRLGHTLLMEGHPKQALLYARQIVQLDSLCEAGHFLLIQSYAKLNRPEQAMQQYQQLQDLWEREFQCQPSPSIHLWISRFMADRSSP